MVWPGSCPDDPMSPASFYDDGALIEDRLPRESATNPNPAVNAWAPKSNDSPSTYDGSYFDDGADMLPRRAPGPGFGVINPQFHDESRAKRREKRATPNHPAVQRAASGDINRTMRDINKTRGLRVPDWYIPETKPWGWEKKEDEETEKNEGEEGKRKNGEPIRVWAFPGWSDFIIHNNDGSGRVIVVTDDGEFDSGPMPLPLQHPDPRAVFETGLKESQQGQPSRAKRKVKQVNFEGYERSNVCAKGDTSDAVPLVLPLSRQERKEKSREEKEKTKAVQKESDQDICNVQGAWMSGGRSGWPQSKSDQRSKSIPKETWGGQHTLPTPQEAWMSGGLSGWPSQAKLACLPVGDITFEKRHGKAGSIQSSPILSQTPLDAWSSAPGRPPSPTSSEDSWEADMKEMDKVDKRPSNYHSPTVEDVAGTPMNKPQYKNGYDEDEDTYLNARRGNVRYREDLQWGRGWL